MVSSTATLRRSGSVMYTLEPSGEQASRLPPFSRPTLTLHCLVMAPSGDISTIRFRRSIAYTCELSCAGTAMSTGCSSGRKRESPLPFSSLGLAPASPPGSASTRFPPVSAMYTVPSAAANMPFGLYNANCCPVIVPRTSPAPPNTCTVAALSSAYTSPLPPTATSLMSASAPGWGFTAPPVGVGAALPNVRNSLPSLPNTATLWFPRSPTYTLPSASTATPCGCDNSPFAPIVASGASVLGRGAASPARASTWAGGGGGSGAEPRGQLRAWGVSTVGGTRERAPPGVIQYHSKSACPLLHM